MQNNVEVKIRRYNIYSCLTIKIGTLEVCFDPAKIRANDLNTINPDVMFISHESMDHMDPNQIYLLHKKKRCKIFCSIAAAVDLSQYFSQDIEFVDSLQVLMPGCNVNYNNLLISTAKSIHCDYMMPLVFKLSFIEHNISLLHCFDSHISEEIVHFSKGVDLGIIPIGIAKGASPASGLEFVQKLHCKNFITNHFKDEQQLKEFNDLIKKEKNNIKFLLVNWNESSEINIIPSASQSSLKEIKNDIQKTTIEDFCDILLMTQDITLEHLKNLLVRLCDQRCRILQDKKLLNKLFSSYKDVSEEKKIYLLIIFTMISLIDPYLLNEKFIMEVKKDLLINPSNQVNNLRVVVLFFLGVYSQQIAACPFIKDVSSLIYEKMEHDSYWMVEFLGRTSVSKEKDYQQAIAVLMEVIKNETLYNSVVVRRKIFWELYRIMKYIPHVSSQFFNTFEKGLVDSNPDVRLLAILCFGLANRINLLSSSQILKIFELFTDPEDDVRETAVKIVGKLMKNHTDLVLQNKNKILGLLKDHNCHVQAASQETLNLISG